jgi:transketolase
MSRDDRIVVMTADLVGSCRLQDIERDYPERFVNVGVAEQNMIGVAAGLAHGGMAPFAHSFAVFVALRACEQVRSDLFYNRMNVTVVGTHSGISTGPAGPTHYSLEDIAVVRALPESVVIVPADAVTAGAATRHLAAYDGPAYLRLDRNPLPVLYDTPERFAFGRINTLRAPGEVAILATGAMVAVALETSLLLEEVHSISAGVFDVHTIKPLDRPTILEAASRCRLLATVEEHNTTGGLGGAVAETLAAVGDAAPLRRFGIDEQYLRGGPLETGRRRAGLEPQQIAAAIVATLEGSERRHT